MRAASKTYWRSVIASAASPSELTKHRQYCSLLPILMCILSVHLMLGCAPSINGGFELDSPKSHRTDNEGDHLVERAIKELPTSSMSVVTSQRLKTQNPPPIEASTSPKVFSPSDRIWGSMLLPAENLKRLREELRSKEGPFSIVIYGDSHTQGGYLGDAMAHALNTRLNQGSLLPQASFEESPQAHLPPGFISLGHPTKSAAELSSTGYWIRQNWIYKGDRGSFGPLGIAFSTQDKSASIHLKIRHHRGVKVTAYFERTGRELPFCLFNDQSEEIKNCYEPSPFIEGESSLGSLSLRLDQDQSLSLRLMGGSQISDQLIRLRTKGRKTLKKKRARLSKRYPKSKRETLYQRMKTPSYVADPQLVFPSKPYLQFLGFEVESIRDDQSEREIRVHSMGVRGATIWSPVNQGDSTLTDWVKLERPQVIATWFGTNTAAREGGDLTVYESRFRTVIQRLKEAAPESVCLVITPPDFGRRSNDCFLSKGDRRLLNRKSKNHKFLQRLSDSRQARVCEPDLLIHQGKRGRHRFPVPEVRNDREWEAYKQSCEYRAPVQLEAISKIQREVGLSEGCVVFDTLNEMGGLGSMQKWACVEPKRWAQLDLVHLSALGYELLGAQIANGLLSSLEDAPLPPITLGTQLESAQLSQ